ncbi:MAG: hypothetical protein AAF360_15930 [Pseudomonadota bacterium]
MISLMAFALAMSTGMNAAQGGPQCGCDGPKLISYDAGTSSRDIVCLALDDLEAFPVERFSTSTI